MPDVGERLRASDPARAMRPLDPAEQAAVRRAMRAAAAPRPSAAWKLAGGAAVAASAIGITLLLPQGGDDAPVPQPLPVHAPLAAPLAVLPPSALVQEPEVAAVEVPEPVAPAVPTTSPAREVRFVTARGTQIVWTFRSPEEGA